MSESSNCNDGRTSPGPSSACSGPGMGNLRALRSGKSGSDDTVAPSVLCEDSQKLRSFQGQPRVAERAGGVSISTSASPRTKRTALWCRPTPCSHCEVLSDFPSMSRNMPNSASGTCDHRGRLLASDLIFLVHVWLGAVEMILFVATKFFVRDRSLSCPR